ncbi:MAG: hypothetical protein GEV28_39005 [Actinophytocola sp.]|uniref:hypothetical protein n=1 Tax=Actinophytocola sp. TaxID=1872138 RepID=UPI00132A612F|nr:hypothetical protein [Actinophytocola sp.]MPZ86042.1 hypothetical protein [Actinophytocola sp.]
MSFSVDLKALEEFGGLLHELSLDAQNIKTRSGEQLYTSVAGEEAPDSLETGLLFSEVTQLCAEARKRAEPRMKTVEDVYVGSAWGVGGAQTVYEKTDKGVRARVDATYPAVKGGRSQDGERPPLNGQKADPGALFHKIFAVDTNVDDVDVTMLEDFQPKVTAVENFLDGLGDRLSIQYWVREGLRWVLGFDPIEEVLQLFVGDWRSVAAEALMWKNCGGAYGGIARNTNLYQYLEHFWTGNAADAALEYFGKVTAGVDAEVEFYDFLYRLYQEAVHIVYQGYKTVDFLVGTLLDLVIDAGIGNIGKIPKVILRIKELWNAIADVVSRVAAAIRGVRMSLMDGPGGNEPPCPLKDLVTSHGPGEMPSAYRHPGDKD